jgi:hypothetical protein
LRRRGQRPGHHDQVPAAHNEATAWAPQSSACDAQKDNDAQLDRTNVLCHEASDGKYVPRAVPFDLEPGVIDVARTSPLGELYRPGKPRETSLVNQNAGAGSNWAKAQYTKTGTNSDDPPVV